jgi:hypothetical protein
MRSSFARRLRRSAIARVHCRHQLRTRSSFVRGLLRAASARACSFARGLQLVARAHCRCQLRMRGSFVRGLQLVASARCRCELRMRCLYDGVSYACRGLGVCVSR